MNPLVRGAIIEYGSDFLGPLPNVVIFQFNPDSLSRSLQIPAPPERSRQPERNQTGDSPHETISLTAHFSAADQLNVSNPLAKEFGIGPQLAALEQMVYPTSTLSGLIGKALDAIGDALGGSDPTTQATQPIPRVALPNLLFIWGKARVLPITITALSITEQQYDNRLNPIQAEVALTLAIPTQETFQVNDDAIGRGALEYSTLAREAQAILNLANTAGQAAELAVNLAADLVVPF
ncbi:hypothetical protein [Phormidium tenue]|uniref:Uncharacterized protein n=1 Tax=Phormidium tenue NIES-30 TaxID=549789 RepID=A0A1U7J4X8_9CYAN|nr:hypothetical protein [Phormidium tenue]MBD2232779.1 hypothetical protein [Phormidium tenue FACHB-1052]OKH47529.1 hypothetical protein NIES30_13820 [Phormidium tenue NIES-30]